MFNVNPIANQGINTSNLNFKSKISKVDIKNVQKILDEAEISRNLIKISDKTAKQEYLYNKIISKVSLNPIKYLTELTEKIINKFHK